MASCNACLGIHPFTRPKHYKCLLGSCSCSCSLNHFQNPIDGAEVRAIRKAQKAEERALRTNRRSSSPKASGGYTRVSTGQRFFADSKAKTIRPEDIPDTIKVRTGRWMTDEQRQWIFTLREDNWMVAEIAALMGFCHSAVVAQLRKRKRDVLTGETRSYTDFYEPEKAAS